MKVKITGTKNASVIVASQRGKKSLGKILELGNEYTLLFPKKDNDVVMSGIPGRNACYDDLGIGFVRIPEDMMELQEETNRIIDKSGMNKWGILSSLLYSASKARDIEMSKQEAKKAAEMTGDPIDERALEQTINGIILDYDGAAKTGNSEAVLPKKQRLLSPSVDINLFTEAIIIPLNKDLEPIWDKASAVEVQISPAKLNQLSDIVKSKVYNNFDDPDGFLEVKFSYKGTTKNDAGKNKYAGVEDKVRKVNFQKNDDGTYIDPQVESNRGLFTSISNDSDIIFSRSGVVSFAKTPAELEAAMRKYLSTHRVLPAYIDLEDEKTKKFAKTLAEFGLFSEDSKKYKELMAIIEEQEQDTVVEDVIEELDKGVKELSNSKSVSEANQVLTNNPNVAEKVSGGIADID